LSSARGVGLPIQLLFPAKTASAPGKQIDVFIVLEFVCCKGVIASATKQSLAFRRLLAFGTLRGRRLSAASQQHREGLCNKALSVTAQA